MASPFSNAFLTILGRTNNLVLHGDGSVYIRHNDRWVVSFDTNLGNQRLIKRYQAEVNELQATWERKKHLVVTRPESELPEPTDD